MMLLKGWSFDDLLRPLNAAATSKLELRTPPAQDTKFHTTHLHVALHLVAPRFSYLTYDPSVLHLNP